MSTLKDCWHQLKVGDRIQVEGYAIHEVVYTEDHLTAGRVVILRNDCLSSNLFQAFHWYNNEQCIRSFSGSQTADWLSGGWKVLPETVEQVVAELQRGNLLSSETAKRITLAHRKQVATAVKSEYDRLRFIGSHRRLEHQNQ